MRSTVRRKTRSSKLSSSAVIRLVVVALASCLNLAGCAAMKLLFSGSEKEDRQPRPVEAGPYVLIFAFDGAGYNQLNEALDSGLAPNLAGILGKKGEGGLYEHGYSEPDAMSILPSTTIAAWSSIFTGAGPAHTGITGNEWFVRQEMRFYAPAPVSVSDTEDALAVVNDDLIGTAMQSPTLFQLANVKSSVSLNGVHHGADYFTTVTPASMLEVSVAFIKGALGGDDDKTNIYIKLDRDSVPKLIDSIDQHGLPKIQVVYFPGIDLATHVSKDPLVSEVSYLERITDPLVGKILDAYKIRGALSETYVMVVADHGHTPVLKDTEHALGSTPDNGPAKVLETAGFRPRVFVLHPKDDEQDYQSAFAYQGAIAYVYLADRSTCLEKGKKCDWKKPPRFQEDVMAAARALYRANREGDANGQMKGALDLIFARRPVDPGSETRPFEIFDGRRLVPIADYLAVHPRSDLIDLERRMQWLSVGPYGERAGDILLLTRSGLTRPIEKRFYFSGVYNSWHGSASLQDSHIPLIVANQALSGKELKAIIDGIAGPKPSQLDLVPIVRALLGREKPFVQVPAQSPTKPNQ